MKTLDLDRLKALEKINPCPPAPWEPPVFEEIEIETDRDKAIKSASALRAAADMIVYSDASAQQGQLGAAAVTLGQIGIVEDSRTACVRSASHWSISPAELIGIHQATGLIASKWAQDQNQGSRRVISILSDSKCALQALARPCHRSRQQIVHAILKAVQELKINGIRIRL
jgi:hypothetical protein